MGVKKNLPLMISSGLLVCSVFAAMPGEVTRSSLACEGQAQFFDGVSQWWLQRFDEKRLDCTTNDNVKVVFLGDSITHNWEVQGKSVWAENFAHGRYEAVNCGISSERTENLIWRIEHGQFGTLCPKAFVLMIGTNNLGQKDPAVETPGDTICGIRRIVQLLQMYFPECRIVLHPIFPRGEKADNVSRRRNGAVNEWIRYLADGERVQWCDFNAKLLTADGVLTKEMAPDGLHPSEEGYRIWADELKPFLDYALGYSDKAPEGARQVAPDQSDPKESITDRPTMSAWIDVRIGPKRGEIVRNPELYYDLVFVGDSITHLWEDRGAQVRKDLLGDFSILNLGFSGDRTQHILWDVGDGGLMEGYLTRAIQIMIGTNNDWCNTAEEIARGIEAIVKTASWKHPEARILLLPIFPRGKDPTDKNRVKNDEVNRIIRKLADGKRIFWCDFSDRLKNSDGTLKTEFYMDDFVHLNAAGFAVWAHAMRPHYEAARNERAMKR
jgi:lysophospholipase L1-like esterase